MSRASPRSYPLFLAGLGSWFLSHGMLQLLYQWLVVEELRESPERVGAAQMAMLLPALLLLLVGGAVADRVDKRRFLALMHLLQTGLLLCLAGIVATGGLRYAWLVALGVGMGVVQAFTLPTRDALLSEVAGGGGSREVIGANLAVQVGQAVGGLVAGAASFLGAPLVLGAQAFVLLVGTVPTARIPAPAAPPAPRPDPDPRELQHGLLEVWRSPVLRPAMGLTLSIGLLFVGPYLVVLPLLVRDVYGGGPAQMGVLVAMIPTGAIAAGAVLFARGGLARNGRALLAGQAFSATCMALLATRPSFAGAALLVFGWGIGSAFFMNAGRTLFQTRSSEAHRGKVLAVYALGILGAAPLSAWLTGLGAAMLGPHAVLAIAAGALWVLVVAAGLLTNIARA